MRVAGKRTDVEKSYILVDGEGAKEGGKIELAATDRGGREGERRKPKQTSIDYFVNIAAGWIARSLARSLHRSRRISDPRRVFNFGSRMTLSMLNRGSYPERK